jgi:oxygen-independent coproporphyrinogen-3 oxidase
LKKYAAPLIYDYTEYPTKGVWTDSFGSEKFSEAISTWLPENENVLFYVHTPFCEELCYFCLCSKEITRDYSKVKDYLYNDLFQEISILKSHLARGGFKLNVRELYFGGGSPTYYKEEDFSALLAKLAEVIDFDAVETFTVEIDPRRVTREKLQFYALSGVNRLSFGVQDFDLEVQKEINRIQPAELLEELLVPEVRSLFKTVNFDILVGLPKQTPMSMRETIERVCSIGPDEVQPLYVHYKPNTRSYMTRMVRNVLMPDFYDRKAIYAEVVDGLIAGGYVRAGYENFAKPTDVLSRAMSTGTATYNSLGTTTCENTSFISVGSSAHGVFSNYYYQNYYERDQYSLALKSGKFPVYRGLELSRDDMIRRDIIKYFRIYDSLQKPLFEGRWGIKFDTYFLSENEKIEGFVNDGLVNNNEGVLQLTPLGREFTPRFCEIFDKYANRPLVSDSFRVNVSQLRMTTTSL